MKKNIFFLKGFTKLFQSNHFFIQLNQKDKNLNRIEEGRSMVEILGVLAIIGVLSIGGIMGYRYALDKYHANNILNDLNIIYHSIQTQSLNEVDENGSPVQDLGITPATPYPFRVYIEGEELTSIQISNLPYRICKQLALTEPPFALFTEINDDNRIGCQEKDDNHILYLFSQKGNKLVEGENCSFNVGVDSYDNSANCPTNQVCYHDKCTSCQRDEAELKNHQCVSCAEKENVSFGTTDSPNCHKCPQRFLGTNSYCYPCSTNTAYYATSAECTQCTNRVYISGLCYDCNAPTLYYWNKETCSKCPNRFYTKANVAWKEYCSLAPEDSENCTGEKGSACTLPDKDYKGFCLSGKCADYGRFPEVPWELANSYCASQGGLLSMKELAAISGDPGKCAVSENYLRDNYHVCPDDNTQKNKYKDIPNIVNGVYWTQQRCSYYPDYWVVNFANGIVASFNLYVYTARPLCKNQLFEL